MAWLADNDPLLTSDDSRKFASFGGSLFKRVNNDPNYNSGANYSLGDRVYSDGFVYEAINNLPNTSWNGTESNNGDQVSFNSGFYELLVNLNTHKVDDFTSVDSGNHSFNSTINTTSTGSSDAYKAGDVVRSSDGTFFAQLKTELRRLQLIGIHTIPPTGILVLYKMKVGLITFQPKYSRMAELINLTLVSMPLFMAVLLIVQFILVRMVGVQITS